MNLRDSTKNQHFIPQVEQRLNSLNPWAKEQKQRIYSFSLCDRETHIIRLDSEKGFKISNTLSLNDVFSFEVIENGASRYNFERLFSQYEATILKNTKSLISKLDNPGADIKSEIVNLYISKFLNFVRNPFSIKKVINTFPGLSNIHPTDPDHYRNFERVLNGRKPHQKYICDLINVSEDDYCTWLSIIFLLLSSLKEGEQNFLEQIVKSLYDNRETFIMVLVYTYNEKTCLLSDRGFSTPLPEGGHMAWDFNLCSHAFIRYMFGEIDLLAPENVTKEMVERFKERPKSIDVYRFHNDLGSLAQYNRNVVYQCYKNVFNSSVECYGL